MAGCRKGERKVKISAGGSDPPASDLLALHALVFSLPPLWTLATQARSEAAVVFCRTPNAECTVCLRFSSFTHVCLRLVFVC